LKLKELFNALLRIKYLKNNIIKFAYRPNLLLR
jgi:hypothetical protein